MRPALVAAGGARHLPRPQIGFRGRRLEIGLRVVFAEQRHEVFQVARPHAVRDEPAPVLGVADARAVVGELAGVTAGHAPQRNPPTHPVHQILLRVFRRRLMDGERQILPLAGAGAVDQRGDDAGRELLAGDVVGVPDLRRDRRRVVFEIRVRVVAAIHHHAAEREMNQVRCLEIGPGPVVAKRCHARRHQLREACIERGAVEAERGIERAAARVEQDVGAAEQPQ